MLGQLPNLSVAQMAHWWNEGHTAPTWSIAGLDAWPSVHEAGGVGPAL